MNTKNSSTFHASFMSFELINIKPKCFPLNESLVNTCMCSYMVGPMTSMLADAAGIFSPFLFIDRIARLLRIFYVIVQVLPMVFGPSVYLLPRYTKGGEGAELGYFHYEREC